tara:strand:- start:173 stop:559 length:387 start_codon:yes stop_codon:yes gene_type:complete
MNHLLLSLLALVTLAESVFASLPVVVIKNCYDGDTCQTINGEKIRLACIDTPELKGRKANIIPATKARDFLNSLVANKEVFIRRITLDKYGRTVAELIKDEENVQELIVKNGFGKIYRKYSYQCEWSS